MLERYGWSETLQREYAIEPGLLPARVIIQQRGLYVVVCALGEMTASLSGRFMRDAAEGDFPVAGDWVAVAARPSSSFCRARAFFGAAPQGPERHGRRSLPPMSTSRCFWHR